MFTPGDIATKPVHYSLVLRQELEKGESIVLGRNKKPWYSPQESPGVTSEVTQSPSGQQGAPVLNQCALHNHAAKHRNAGTRQVSVCCGGRGGGCQYHPSRATTGLMRANAWLLLRGVRWASVGEARRPHGTRVLPNTPRFSHELQVVCLATFWASTFQGGHWGRYGVNIHPS